MRRLVSLTLVLPLALSAQQVPSRALATAEAEFAESFDQILAVRELPSGKVLVTDLGPKAVLLADFASGTQSNVGRNGQGPGEYQFPGELLPYRGDSVLLVDRVSRRFLLISPDGKLGRTIPFPDGLGGMPEPRGADRQGRLYFQASPFRGGPGNGMEISENLPDTVPVIRFDPVTKKVDTITRVKIPALKVQTSGNQNSRMVMMRSQPFAAADDLVVSPEGRVAVARTGDYRVEWFGGATPVRGAPVRYDRLKVGAGDKQAFMSATRNTRNRITVNSGGPGPGDAQPPRPPEPSADEFDWPEYLPPFPARSLRLAPEGQLWLPRSTSARDSTPVYDLFDASGRHTGRVTLPLGRRLVGLGKGVLYATRTDEDGLQWLERYRR
ncbi:MAG: hypothetical protein SF070_11160 [Gemmatimonadota bacterium]|nr:hypothetical protein [Gemmatimonadota bacterium]